MTIRRVYLVRSLLTVAIFGMAFATGTIIASSKEVDRSVHADDTKPALISRRGTADAVGSINVPELHFNVTSSTFANDIVYRTGMDGPEGYPSVSFASKQLEATGGEGCAVTNATNAFVSRVGMAYVSPEKPDDVDKERSNEAEALGEYAGSTGKDYIYFIAPDSDGYCSTDADAVALQSKIIQSIKQSLKSAKNIQ